MAKLRLLAWETMMGEVAQYPAITAIHIPGAASYPRGDNMFFDAIHLYATGHRIIGEMVGRKMARKLA